MSHPLLTQLRQDHDNLRSLRQPLADQMAVVAGGDEPDCELMGELVVSLLDDPELYHQPLERRLVERLRVRRPAAEPLARRLYRRQHQVARLGRRLQRHLDELAVDAPVRRRSFVRLGERYLHTHESLLELEEDQLFPLLEASLEPTDWLEVTTAFDWYCQPVDPAVASAPHGDLRQRVTAVLGESLSRTRPGVCPLCAAD